MRHSYQPAGVFAAVLLVVCSTAVSTATINAQEPANPQASEKSELSTTADPIQDNSVASKTVDTGGIVLVVGAAGAEEYGEEFDTWADQWQQVASTSGIPLKTIGQQEIGQQETGAESDFQRLQLVLESVQPKGQSPLWIVLIGHGTFSRNVAKFNLRGPDVSATQMAEWLAPITRPVVIVNCAAASGPFVNRLSGPNRIVVTSTKSGVEQNFARFGRYFAEAIADIESDLDHDGEVSVQEAFLRASDGVRQFYDSEGRIATEHSLIDDNGDGRGTPASMFRGTRPIATAKDGAALDGTAAARITLSPNGSRLPFTEDELAERAKIESQLDQLRKRKEQMSEQAYDGALEPLMLRLAKIYQAAEERAE